MSEANGHFPTTRWSVVLRAGERDSADSQTALEALCQSYWLPCYAYARRLGHGREDARDLTQEFFAQFLARNYLGVADRRRGRFRTFLLTCLKHFLTDEWHKRKTMKRGGDYFFIPWDELVVEQELEWAQPFHAAPERTFDKQWALTVMDEALNKLRDRFESAGKGKEFSMFKPFLTGEPAIGDYASIARELNLSVNSVTVAVHRFRNRFRGALREQVLQTVANPGDVDEEMRSLAELLIE
jgi:RNA polymerase sigma-70 factor (ECF subfamily)